VRRARHGRRLAFLTSIERKMRTTMPHAPMMYASRSPRPGPRSDESRRESPDQDHPRDREITDSLLALHGADGLAVDVLLK